MRFTFLFFFFFQAEDGIRDATVTGVQTCALPILGEVCEIPQLRSTDRKREDVRATEAPNPRSICIPIEASFSHAYIRTGHRPSCKSPVDQQSQRRMPDRDVEENNSDPWLVLLRTGRRWPLYYAGVALLIVSCFSPLKKSEDTQTTLRK